MAICEVCGTDYPSKRADSKTCGPACRKARARLSVTKAKCDKAVVSQIIQGYGGPDCQCKMCQGSATPASINHGPYLDAKELAASGFNRNRVSLPGDPDYTDSAGIRLLAAQEGTSTNA